MRELIPKNKFKILLITLLIIFFTVSYLSKDILTVENAIENKETIIIFIDENYILSTIIFFILCIILINSPIPLAGFLKLVGGFFFGIYIGAIYNILATTLAGIAGFAISRYALKNTFQKMYSEKLKKMENEIKINGFYYFLTLRLILVIPYFFINIFAGISKISMKKYIASTFLGVIPASILYANAGSQLEKINSVKDIFSFEILIAFTLLILFSLIPLIWKKIVKK